ncbi:Autophagy protein 7 [Physocladia obscura]|uniref:Ubiquitin-like modifier-activating enzyme ATG7 n=1 Tax=Physocladia obscura TaxID=109957 RepID=A0AAD5XL90_9FUNG|nr:Autophagy protein 7 [Physocladia obscura]
MSSPSPSQQTAKHFPLTQTQKLNRSPISINNMNFDPAVRFVELALVLLTLIKHRSNPVSPSPSPRRRTMFLDQQQVQQSHRGELIEPVKRSYQPHTQEQQSSHIAFLLWAINVTAVAAINAWYLVRFSTLSLFWQKLAQLKMDEFRLDASPRRLVAHYSAASPLLCLSADAFAVASDDAGSSLTTATAASATATGLIANTNTLELFKAADKQALLKAASEEIWSAIKSGRAMSDQSTLASFSLLTFADLKKFKFYYWFAFPALLPSENFTTPATDGIRPLNKIEELYSGYDNIRTISKSNNDTAFFLVKNDPVDPENSLLIGKLSDWSLFWKDIPAEEWTIAFIDPSNLSNNPGWPLRNFLIMLKQRFMLGSINIICLRDQPSGKNRSFITSLSLFVVVNMPGSLADECPKSVGWEKNSSGKLGARLVDLAPMMDPLRLAETAVDLNLKLMRWRIMPELQLEKISETKCLLLGAGTLGCYVARALMAWGIRKITFVDNGSVSYSNPVRQPLFTFEDSVSGKPKAVAAAEGLKRIFPGVNAEGVNFSIPMPGHPSPSLESTEKSLSVLQTLINQHDAIFLLTDSREARWLPTVLGSATPGKIVINCALGFDTFLVMRHGVRSGNAPEHLDGLHGGDMGCYYCNDVVAPSDSLSDRTLDQQCTVTRPGLSMIASGIAVELMVSLLNHPDGVWAPTEIIASPTDPTKYPLGVVPHQVRGYLTHFSNLLLSGHAYDKCTACSKAIVDAYKNDGFKFVHKVLADPKYLEDLTGLTKLHNETEAADVDWDEEEEQEEF